MINRRRDSTSDWIVLTGLLLTAIFFMVTWNNPLVRNLRTLSLQVASQAEARMTWASQYIRAFNENKTLRRDNVVLNSQLARLNLARMENTQLKEALGFKQESGYSMVAARIISKDIFGQNNFLTLNVGADDNVEVDMPVVNEHGIVGRVVLVSKNYSRVLPYLNTGFRVPVQVRPSFAVGVVSWPGTRPDELVLENIVTTVAVNVGDTLVTSATSQIFPPGYLVGQITEISTITGMGTLDIKVRPAAALDETQHAFVLLHHYAEERAVLEGESVR